MNVRPSKYGEGAAGAIVWTPWGSMPAVRTAPSATPMRREEAEERSTVILQRAEWLRLARQARPN
ncbi:hypothetical protein [Mesorhizobium xinjiangense]|uniref:hypothetical protein n=1 Tax=Mesorhizobium xinjiangense TaxID=2678685 RepID=UPI0012ED879A|nr:hypothetical protein [Mesorhizobium xinjiangense]